MTAPDVEGLTDQIVEYTPGERDLAERIARGIWPLVVEAQVSVLVEAADEAQRLSPPFGICDHQWLRDRADALSGDLGDGLAGRRGEGVRAGEGNLASLRGQLGRTTPVGIDEGDDHE